MYVIDYGTKDEDGTVLDIYDRDYFCSAWCAFPRDTKAFEDQDDIVGEDNWPGGIESDSNEYCAGCGSMLTHGMSVEDCLDPECPDCRPPLVIGTNLYADDKCGNCGCTQYVGDGR